MRINRNDNLLKAYTSEYQSLVYSFWIKNDKPGIPTLLKLIPEDEYGRKPNKQTITNWKKEQGWEERYELIDIASQEELDKQLIRERVEMLQRHAALGRKMSDAGEKWLDENEIDSAAMAIRAVESGRKIEAESSGLGASLIAVFSMSDTQVQKELTSLLHRVKGLGEDIIDVDEIPDDED